MADVFRGAVLAVARGQWEAGRAIGLRTPGILVHIVLPQALRVAGRPYVNTLDHAGQGHVAGVGHRARRT